MGIFSAKTRLHAWMPPIQPLSGGVSMVSQSGNVGVQMLGWGMERGVGFSKFISSGTEGNIQCEAYIDYLGSDPDTKVILAYLEGVKEGRLFFETARRTARKKPIILFKGGKTDVGSNAARSHSGAMAGSYTVFKAACHQAGFVEAETTDRLLDYAAVFLHYPLPKGNRIAILTRGGGWGVVAADACRQWGMELPLLSDRLIEKLNRILPPYWSHGNPVDMAATLNPEALPNCLEALIQEEGVDGIIVQGVESRQRSLLMAERLKEMNLLEDIDLGINKNETPEIQKLMEIAAAHQKPVLMVSPLSNITRSVSFGGQEAVIFSTPERAVRAMAKLCLYHSYLQRA